MGVVAVVGKIYYSKVYIPSKSDFGLWNDSFTICDLQTESWGKYSDCRLTDSAEHLVDYYGWNTRTKEQISARERQQQQHVTGNYTCREKVHSHNICSVNMTQCVIPLIYFVHLRSVSLTQTYIQYLHDLSTIGLVFVSTHFRKKADILIITHLT